ncbi:MAG: hypothetical protein IKO42_02800, partial [Opitutales bacterium]|nr:hypothetical protein [Opitutales bacterium]
VLNFLLAHEAGHIIFKSMLRRGARNPLLWNIATDYAINGALIDANLPEDRLKALTKNLDGKEFKICYSKKYTGWASEAIYEDILKKIKKPPQPVLDSAKNGMPSGKDKNGGQGGWSLPVDGERSFDPKTGETDFKKGDGTAATPRDVESQLNTVIAQAAFRAREDMRRKSNLRGRGAGAFLEYVEVALSRQINWRNLLHRKLRSIGFETADYSRPSRRTIVNRQLGCKFYYPKLRGFTPGNIMMVIDTSGSVSSESLEVFLGEINNCLKGMPRAEVYLYCADYGIKFQGTYRSSLPASVEITGRGGTSFEPAFEEAQKLLKAGKKFSTMVYFTDGCCDYPQIKAKSLPYEVLWCIDNFHAADAPFGKTLRIDANQ